MSTAGTTSASQAPRATPGLTRAGSGVATFHRILVNTLFANITSSYLWFALTFWVYLESRSVLATSIVSGLYMLASALTGTIFGAIVDAHRKKTAMLVRASSPWSPTSAPVACSWASPPPGWSTGPGPGSGCSPD